MEEQLNNILTDMIVGVGTLETRLLEIAGTPGPADDRAKDALIALINFSRQGMDTINRLRALYDLEPL